MNRFLDSEGRKERLKVLRRHFAQTEEIVNQAAAAFTRSQAAFDDIVDALVAAVTAKLGNGQLKTLPTNPRRDSFGLPMEIVFS